jgi:hypothetical protein
MRSRVVPLPPEVDAGTCRWCEARKREGRCIAGCSDVLIHDERCQECSRSYQTGKRMPVLCWQCERGEAALMAKGYQQKTLGQGRGEVNTRFRRIGGTE